MFDRYFSPKTNTFQDRDKNNVKNCNKTAISNRGELKTPSLKYQGERKKKSQRKMAAGKVAAISLDMNERQIALSVVESLRGELMYALLSNGNRVLDVADLRQYFYEQTGRIKTNALAVEGLYGHDKGHGQDIDGHKGKAH